MNNSEVEDRKYIMCIVPEEGTDNVSTIQITAMKEFDEVGQYTQDECHLIRKAIEQTPRPTWIVVEWIMEEMRSNHEEAMEQWDEWKRQMMKRYNELKEQQ